MRTVTGNIILPANISAAKTGHVLIEVRDVSLADAPSALVAEKWLENLPLQPNGQIPFKICVPEVEPNRTLSLRVHISLDRSGRMNAGDLLTTTNYTIPNTGDATLPEVVVVVI